MNNLYFFATRGSRTHLGCLGYFQREDLIEWNRPSFDIESTLLLYFNPLWIGRTFEQMCSPYIRPNTAYTV